MGKKYKLFSLFLGILGILCFAMYFVMGGNAYKVTFDSDGGSSIQEQKVKAKEMAKKPVDPIKEGYTFDSWMLNGVVYDFNLPVVSNNTLKANWKAMITVTIELEEEQYEESYAVGDKINIDDFNLPSKEGYKIVFYLKNNASDEETKEENQASTNEREVFDLDTTLTEALTLYAEYVKLKEVTITFDSDGGTKVDSIQTLEGKVIEEPKVEKEGFIFLGWFDGDKLFDFSKPVEKDMTIVANWKDGDKVNVNFFVDDQKYDTIRVAIGAKATKPKDPVKAGYIFEGWKNGTKMFDFNTAIENDISLNASFRVAKIFKVTFNSDGGTDVPGQDITENEKVKKPDNPTKIGYNFIEWTYEDKPYDFNKEVTAHMTLKAKWEKIEEFTVTFDSDGGTSVPSQKVKPNNTATRPENPTKENYVFAGWLLNNEDYDFTKPVTGNITLKAVWQSAPIYNVSFNSNGGTIINTQFVRAGYLAEKPKDPVKSGSTFVEWQLNGVSYDFSTPVNGNITLTALWQD